MTRAAPGTNPPRRLGVQQYFDGTRLCPGDVEIAGGVVTAVGLPPGGAGTACRGWLDLQVNGFAGVDVLHASEAELRTLARRIVETGVTALLPTVITAAAGDTEAALAVIDRVRERPATRSARILGAHLEGPLLSPAYAGAHRKDLLCDDADRLSTLVADHGVAMVTLAPELVADRTIAALAGAGSVVSIGHTDATAARSTAAFGHGAVALTHAFNAHRPVTAREAGPLGAALVDGAAVLTVIADGVHVAKENLRILHRAAPGRLALVTDGIVASGLGDGSYRFGPLAVEVTHGRALLPDGTLAGSVATMDHCVRHAAALWGIEAALTAVTTTPAALIGRPELAVLAVGSRADLVRLDDELAVAETYLAGESSWQRPNEGTVTP